VIEEERVARLSAAEFQALIEELVRAEGIAKLQDKLLRSRALVSRRRLGNVEALARQLYQLTLGLDRDGLASQVVVALWEDFLRQKLDDDASKRLEEIAEKVNSCLVAEKEIDPAKELDLRGSLQEYQAALAEHVGATAARLTMLTRAYPAVARVIRELSR
jgi:hypothetical protein